MCSVCTPLTTTLFQNVLNMSNVHLNNKDTHKEILHCKTQNIGISIFDDCIFNSSDLQCFEDDCYRHNSKKSHKIYYHEERLMGKINLMQLDQESRSNGNERFKCREEH
jgi:hypothetical protein